MVFYRVLELAARHDPVRYNDIRAAQKPRDQPPQQRGTGPRPAWIAPPRPGPGEPLKCSSSSHSA
jgi:hypothetical protein